MLLVVWIVLVVKEEHECFTFRSELVATFIIAETIAIRIHVTHLPACVRVYCNVSPATYQKKGKLWSKVTEHFY